MVMVKYDKIALIHAVSLPMTASSSRLRDPCEFVKLQLSEEV